MVADRLGDKPGNTMRRGLPDNNDFSDNVFSPYQERIFNFLYRTVGSRERAEELTQDTFLRAYEGIRKVEGELKTKAWLYAIARNLATDQLRRDGVISFEPLDPTVHPSPTVSSRSEQPEQYAVMSEDQREIRKALESLPPHYRQILLYREVEGLSCQEIGERRGVTRSAAKSLLFRARIALREEYDKISGSPKVTSINNNHEGQAQQQEKIMEPKPTKINISSKEADIPGYTLEDAADITADQYKLATLLFPIKPEPALSNISQVAERMRKPIPWVTENRLALSWKLWYENDRTQGLEQNQAEEIPPTKALLLQRLDHIPIYTNTSMRERDSLMWFDLTPADLEERRSRMLAADPQSTISFKENLNGEEVDPMDPKLTLPEVLRLLYDLQRQEGATRQIKWQTPENAKIARKVASENGILERVYTSFANLLPKAPEDYDLIRGVAGRFFNELSILSQRVKLPPTLTLLSDVRTIAFYKRLFPDSEIDITNGIEMSGLKRKVSNETGNTNGVNSSVAGISLPDAVAVNEDDLGGLKITEIHEYTTSLLRGRVPVKYAAYRNFHSKQAPDLLPADATFVYVFLKDFKIGERVSLSIKQEFADAVVRSQALGLGSSEFSRFIRDFIGNFRPEPDTLTLDEMVHGMRF